LQAISSQQSHPTNSGIINNKGVRRIWRKHGLTVPRLLEGRQYALAGPESRAAAFREALEESGGLFAAFGRFLAGRLDLLSGQHLLELAKIGSPHLYSSRLDSHPEIKKALSDVKPVDHSLFASRYQGRYQGQVVIVELFPPPGDSLEDASWSTFLSGVRELEGSLEGPVAQPGVLEDFHGWLEVHQDCERKRRMLTELQSLPTGCVCRFPAPVESLQSERVLTYHALPGRPLRPQVEPLDETHREKALSPFFEAALEQLLLLSTIPAEWEPDHLLLTGEGGVGFRLCPALYPVPPDRNFEVLQYLASTLAGDSGRALGMLLRMVRQFNSSLSERALWDQLSSAQLDLQVEDSIPDSVLALGGQWRALARTGSGAPLFLHLFHRSMVQLGQMNQAWIPQSDLISGSMWAVTGRTLRFHLEKTLSISSARHWMLGSTLLFLGSARQLAVTLEQIREKDLSVTVTPHQRSTPRGNSRIFRILGIWVAAALFLLTIRWALIDPGIALPASLAAAAAGIVMYFLIARMASS